MGLVDLFEGMDRKTAGILSEFMQGLGVSENAGEFMYAMGFVLSAWQSVRQGFGLKLDDRREAMEYLEVLCNVAINSGLEDIVAALDEVAEYIR